VDLYGCKTWTLILREEQRLRVFPNRVLTRIFGPKRDEVTGVWRKLHNEKTHKLRPLPDIIKNDQIKEEEVGRYVARMGEKRNAYRILVGKPESKRPLARP
jgi:hypothetical protein